MAIIGNAGAPTDLAGQSAGEAYAALLKDPQYLQTSADLSEQIQYLEADILEAKRRAMIDYGDPELAAKTLKENRAEGPETTQWQIGVRGTLPDRYADAAKKIKGKTFGSREEALAYAQQLAPGQYDVFRISPKKVSGAQGATVKAAQDNPYSTLAGLRRARELDFYDLRENINKAQLWYSTERGRREGLLGLEHGGRMQQAGTQLERWLSDLDKQQSRAQTEANKEKQKALQAGAQRIGAGGGRAGGI